MAEELLSGGGPTSDSDLVCPWCSATLPSADVERCPSCGAALKEPDAAVPGVTQIDVDAILKSRSPSQKPQPAPEAARPHRLALRRVRRREARDAAARHARATGRGRPPGDAPSRA